MTLEPDESLWHPGRLWRAIWFWAWWRKEHDPDERPLSLFHLVRFYRRSHAADRKGRY